MKSQDEKLQQLKDETYQTARYLELLEDDKKQNNFKLKPTLKFNRIMETKYDADLD